jgi:hypothetical protein
MAYGERIMRSIRKTPVLGLLSALAIAAGGCGRAPAEEALKAAEAALEAARPSVE